jgi:alpha-tubulin suppressor-like RCC1 family protein
MATLGFTDNDGADLGVKYVTKEYVMDWYPDLVPNMVTPQLWAWGMNTNGQLGTNNTSNYSSPVTTAGGGTNWKQVACANYHTAAIKTDGTLWNWGLNGSGQLGDNTVVSKLSPVTTAGGGTNWKQVACGYYHTAAIKTDGTLWTWGYNFYAGQLGDNTIANKSSPVTVVGGITNWSSISNGNRHSLGLRSSGLLYGWGYNTIGQVGDNTATQRNSPVLVSGGITNWSGVEGGGYHSLGLTSAGVAYAWGQNTNGHLGDNTTSVRSSPVTVVGGITTWAQVSGGQSHSAAINAVALYNKGFV